MSLLRARRVRTGADRRSPARPTEALCKLAYLFISHDLKVVRALANDIIVLRHGKVVEQGPARTVFAEPKTDYTKALLAAAFDARSDTRWRRRDVSHWNFDAVLRFQAWNHPPLRSEGNAIHARHSLWLIGIPIPIILLWLFQRASLESAMSAPGA